MLNEFEQRVYNTYLAVSRSAVGKPFTLRKDFSDFNETDHNYVPIKKLAHFFQKHPQVDQRVYFLAPFEIYKDGEHYDLKFFTTQKAIGLYSMLSKRLQEQSPDTDSQMQEIKSSLGFVVRYCYEHKIKIADYISYLEPGSTTEAYLSHYKNKQVNLYVLLKLPGFERHAYSLDEELRSLFFGESLDQLSSFKIKLHQSQKAKPLIEDILRKASTLLAY